MSTLHKRSHYPLTVDCVIFGYTEGSLKIALIKRKTPPFQDSWALPGGFVEGEETVEEAAKRELAEETGIRNIYLESFQVYSAPDRDPRGRIISVAFFALVNSDQFTLFATEDAAAADWIPMNELPTLAFDHQKIFAQGLDAMRNACLLQPLVFELLPEFFTLTQLQTLYEQIYGIEVDKRNFRKKLLKTGYIEKTTKVTEGQKHRPASLYTCVRSALKNWNQLPFLTSSKLENYD